MFKCHPSLCVYPVDSSNTICQNQNLPKLEIIENMLRIKNLKSCIYLWNCRKHVPRSNNSVGSSKKQIQICTSTFGVVECMFKCNTLINYHIWEIIKTQNCNSLRWKVTNIVKHY